MAMMRWDPVREVITLRDAMDRLFQEAFVQSTAPALGAGSAYAVPVDVYQTEKDVVVIATLPGVKPDDLDLTLEKGNLVIKGEVKADPEVAGSYVMRERRTGTFGRIVPLPSEVEAGAIDAKFEHGVLTVTLPKAESVRPKQIKVRTA